MPLVMMSLNCYLMIRKGENSLRRHHERNRNLSFACNDGDGGELLSVPQSFSRFYFIRSLRSASVIIEMEMSMSLQFCIVGDINVIRIKSMMHMLKKIVGLSKKLEFLTVSFF